MSEGSLHRDEPYERTSEETTEEKVQNLVAHYISMARKERAKFVDDSYDSDVGGAWSTVEMLEARRNYDLYMAIAHDITSTLR